MRNPGLSGESPPDTTLAFIPAEARTIILRHPPPDNSEFAQLVFPAQAFGNSTDSVRVTLRARPGAYGLELVLPGSPGKGSIIRFKYPVHFALPKGAQDFGGAAGYERALSIAHQVAADRYNVLKTRRPGPDNLEADLDGPGPYVVAAVRH